MTVARDFYLMTHLSPFICHSSVLNSVRLFIILDPSQVRSLLIDQIVQYPHVHHYLSCLFILRPFSHLVLTIVSWG